MYACVHTGIYLKYKRNIESKGKMKNKSQQFIIHNWLYKNVGYKHQKSSL